MQEINTDIAVRLQQASVSFLLKGHGIFTFKDLVHSRGTRKMLWKQILSGIDLEIMKGECMGVMGRNGSGKSTLLRLISGIIPPDKGTVYVNGKVSPLLTLGVGLEPELSGKENIRLLCLLQGIPSSQINDTIESVRTFSELSESDLKMPVKRYSTGMSARLAFSVAIANRPDIFVIDEVLAVGDLGFQEKCYERMEEIRRSGSTIIFVSHSVQEMQKICTRAVLLENGSIALQGSIQDVSAAYEQLFHT